LLERVVKEEEKETGRPADSKEQRRAALLVVNWCREFYRNALRVFVWRAADRLFQADTETAAVAEGAGQLPAAVEAEAGGSEAASEPNVPEAVCRFVERFDVGSRHDLDWLVSFIERTNRAEELLDRNVSTALCLESLFTSLARIARTGPRGGS